MSIEKYRFKKELEEAIGSLNLTLEVGFFEGSIYPNGNSVASVAFNNEYGNAYTPPRPFFRNAISKNYKKWGEFFLRNQKDNFEISLGVLGEKIRGDIVKSIDSLTSPPLKSSTIKRKGSSKPLIDTGLMRASVTFKVKDGK